MSEFRSNDQSGEDRVSRSHRDSGNRSDHRGYGRKDREDERFDRRGGYEDKSRPGRGDRPSYGGRRSDDPSDSSRRDSRGYGQRPSRNGDKESRGGSRRDDRRGGARGDNRRGGWEDERKKPRTSGPQRSGFREQRINNRSNDPDIPADIDPTDLDPSVLQDLKSLSKDNAEATAKHMIMAATLMDDDPELALRHARAAKDRAGRVSVAREVNGIAAYRAGEWKEALAELRAARRISGGPGMLAVMADCERGLGKPEKAIELGRSEEARKLDRDGTIELAIVVAGARQDLGQSESALVTLERANPDKKERGMGAARLAYAYADALLELGRKAEALSWFKHAAKIDVEGWTDVEARLEEFK